MFKTLLLSVVTALTFSLAAPAHGQANLSFSGGNNSPITLTLNLSVTYVITNSGTGPFFVFQNVGDIFGGGSGFASGTITFTVNGGTPVDIDFVGSGSTMGAIGANDVQAFNPTPSLLSPLNVGDVVTLNAGSITTDANYASAPPAGGAYNTFIVRLQDAGDISAPGVAVPEPSVLALSGLAGLGAFLWRRRRSTRVVRY